MSYQSLYRRYRPRRFAEFAEDLRCFLEGRPVRARRLQAWEQVVRWCRRRPAVAALLLVRGSMMRESD